jgi:hypothetical protein
VHPVGTPAMCCGRGRFPHLRQPHCQAGAPFPSRARSLSARVDTTTGSQCARSNRWSGDDQAVRHPARLCHLTRPADGLTWLRFPWCPPSSDRHASPSEPRLSSFPGFVAFPLIFCPFRSLFLYFCSLFQAQCPVLHDFRSRNQEVTLQQPRCAIRGNCVRSSCATHSIRPSRRAVSSWWILLSG